METSVFVQSPYCFLLHIYLKKWLTFTVILETNWNLPYLWNSLKKSLMYRRTKANGVIGKLYCASVMSLNDNLSPIGCLSQCKFFFLFMCVLKCRAHFTGGWQSGCAGMNYIPFQIKWHAISSVCIYRFWLKLHKQNAFHCKIITKTLSMVSFLQPLKNMRILLMSLSPWLRNDGYDCGPVSESE